MTKIMLQCKLYSKSILHRILRSCIRYHVKNDIYTYRFSLTILGFRGNAMSMFKYLLLVAVLLTSACSYGGAGVGGGFGVGGSSSTGIGIGVGGAVGF
jgi:hypothetical protein